jgi:hypothetical protein
LINNRQNGRRRGRGGTRPQGSPSQQGGGSRIDNRARGNAAQLLEKYRSLARDAQMQGDRVMSEYYFQFADHYFRIVAETRARFEEQGGQPPRRLRDDERGEFGEDGEDEDGGDDDRPYMQQPAMQQPRRDEAGEERPRRDERPRDDRSRDERFRDDRPRGDRARDDRARDDRPRRDDRNRDDRPRVDQPIAEPTQSPVRIEVVNEPAPTVPMATEPAVTEAAPRRRGRPRKETLSMDAATADEGAEARFEADRLPPAVTVSAAPANDEGDPAPSAPRRRGRPRRDAAAAAEA